MQKSKDEALAHELPYWDFIDNPEPHTILFDGSIVAGIKVTLKDVECLGDDEVNGFTAGLRAALNSIAEGTTLQFVLNVNSDFAATIKSHTRGFAENIHPLVKKIADYREKKLNEAVENKELYKPELCVYLRTTMVEQKKVGFLKKKYLNFFFDQIQVNDKKLEITAKMPFDTLIECNKTQNWLHLVDQIRNYFITVKDYVIIPNLQPISVVN